MKKAKGITLVALVITIIILLILAGISISVLTNTEIIQKAKEAKQKSENAKMQENEYMYSYEKEINKYTAQELTSEKINTILSEKENTFLKDAEGNIFVLPAGFKVVDTGDITAEKGIVVEDGKENQYVWIPCTTEESTTQLQYKRTEWDVEIDGDDNSRASKDELTLTDAKCSKEDSDNGLTDEVTAEIVEQIKAERASVSKNGGYYIGRYEVGNENGTAVIKYNQTPYTIGVVWSKAYKLAKGIGGGEGATTYLCSSYAWDTAINFIENNGTKNYATTRENFNENWYDREVRDSNKEVIKSVDDAQRLETGKTTAKCNIFDIGGNVTEFTTEVMPSTSQSAVLRGGSYAIFKFTAGQRFDDDISDTNKNIGFRATLFLK